MATYNGSLYIERQLRSILNQLDQNDEVIVVDDHSSDTTLEEIEKIGDSRIKIFRNDSNKGVLKTFERSMRLASGEIIFLSDQDDIWYPEKVNSFRQTFEACPDVTLVLSDAKIINEADEVVFDSFFKIRGAFSSGLLHNIIKNKHLGCTMAFRQSMMNKFLPFPADIPQHDIWIGCVNSIYGKTCFLNKPLMMYRRHQYNASPLKRQGFVQVLTWRWHLIKNLCLRLME
jgi:glycosyltransferase involved in cell wall biosynthesis